MADYLRCKKCGVTYIDEGKGYCPTCGTPATSSASNRTERAGLLYHFDTKEFIGVVIFAIITIGFAIFNLWQVSQEQSDIAGIRAEYQMAKDIVDSGAYDAALQQYYEMTENIRSGKYYYTDEQMDAYYNLRATISTMPSDIRGYLAEFEGRFRYADLLCTFYIISGVALIVAAVMAIVRLRFAFKVWMIAYIFALVVEVVFTIWGVAQYGIDIAGVRFGARVVVAGSLIKCLWRYNEMAYEDVPAKKNDGWVSVPAPAGAPMPVARDLNEIDVAQTPPDTPMLSVAPVGMAQPTEKDKMLPPTEVAPSVQPVMPLADSQQRRADVGVGFGEAVAPLDRPMMPVSMMEDEAMPDISLDMAAVAPEPQPVMAAAPVAPPAAPAVQPMQPAPEISKGIWFCSKCGSLNENANFCNSCGSPKE